MDSNFVEMESVCGKCHKPFSGQTQYFYDSDYNYKENEFSMLKCPHCGHEAYSGMPFFYYDKYGNVLYYVIDTDHINTFERAKKILEMLLEQHLANSDFSHQIKIKKAQRKFIEKAMLYPRLEGGSKGSFELGVRDFRITPPPSVSIDKEYCFVGNERNYNLTKNDIAIDSIGLSNLQKNIISNTLEKLTDNGFVVNFVESEEERKPSVTCGLISIVLTVGSVVLVPILVNVISDVITDYRHKHEENKELELKKTDEISVSIYQNNTKNVYHFEGRVDDVARAMKECGFNSLNTIALKNTHTALAVDNIIGDVLLPSSEGGQTFEQMAKEYQKVFSADSAIEIIHDEVSIECNEIIVAYKASILMENGDYESAYWMMRPFINEAKTIEFLYNFSLCLSHLDSNKEALQHLYETVIKKYLACPDLRDLEMFDGSITKEELDKITEDFVENGILIRNEDGSVDTPSPTSEEEVLKLSEMNNEIWQHMRSMQKYDIENLKKEAALNSFEAECKTRKKEVDEKLHALMEIVSNRALAQTIKLREFREEHDISDEQWLEMLSKGNLPELDDDNEENLRDEFDELFREKMSLEMIIAKIQADRNKLRSKHSHELL